MHTVTGAPNGRPAHAARAPMPATVWVSAAGLLVLAAGLVAAAGTLVPAGPVPSVPSSANSITVTPTGR